MIKYTKVEFQKILAAGNIVVSNEIFVYKSGKIGTAYINKDALAPLGATVVNRCLRGMAQNAISNGLHFNSKFINKVLIIGPAYGAIGYPPIVAEYLAEKFPGIIFTTARTQLNAKGKHYIPEKLQGLYDDADAYIITEDIVNSGTTVREISRLLTKKVHSVLSLVDRGNNTVEGLHVGSYFPFLRVDMAQYDPRVDPSLFSSLLAINTHLGKGGQWVEQFGKPPYAGGTDFSSFPLFDQD